MSTRVRDPRRLSGLTDQTFHPDALMRRLSPLPVVPKLFVAYSGGADSTALLHALGELGRRGAVAAAICAVHINHGLHPDASAWAAHCRARCRAWDIPCDVIDAQAAAAKGESPEAGARRARYDALAEIAGPDGMVLTAHHADDQVETVLLQLLRGSGPAGLAGMPEWSPLGSGHLGRPLLGVRRSALVAYCRRIGEAWLEDPANRDPQFSRSYLRQEIVPRLETHWPGMSGAVARSARACHEAAELTRDLADLDLQGMLDEMGRLDVAVLDSLAPARQRSALKRWLQRLDLPVPQTDRLETLRRQAIDAREDAKPRIQWRGAEARRWRGQLYAMPPLRALPDRVWPWRPEQELALPNGLLCGFPERGAGLARSRLPDVLQVRYRRGGERLLTGGGHRRAVKSLFQEAAWPPWLRERVPLVWHGDRLVAVPGVGIDPEFRARGEERGVVLRWQSPEGGREAR